MDIITTPEKIIELLSIDYPEIKYVIRNAATAVPEYKGAVRPYQAALLFWLARKHNGGTILEIGTGLGYSSYFISEACPKSYIYTLSASKDETSKAKETFVNANKDHLVTVINTTSRQYYEFAEENNWMYDFIFIDGDHNDIGFDINWYKHLNPGGTIVFHDFTDERSKKPCIPVYKTLLEFCNKVGDMDTYVVDTQDYYGMATWRK